MFYFSVTFYTNFFPFRPFPSWYFGISTIHFLFNFFSFFLFLFFPIYLSVYLSILYKDRPCFNCLKMAGRGGKRGKKERKKEKNTRTSGSYVCSSFIVLVEWDYFLFLFLLLFCPSHFSTSNKMHE